MIKVYIWSYRSKKHTWGHASMDVNGQHISWWPTLEGRVHSKLHNNIYSAHPVANMSLEDDMAGEGDGESKVFPDHTILISGLNEKKIIQWWRRTALSWGGGKALGPPSVPWSSLGWNCSKIVATALKQGGGDMYTSLWAGKNLIWTPNAVRRYAAAIENGIRKKKKRNN